MSASAAIVAEAIAWATARRDHWALVQATYRESGLPSKRDYTAVMAAEQRITQHTRRLEALALEAAGGYTTSITRQMALPLEAQAG